MEITKVVKPFIRRGANTFGKIVYLGNNVYLCKNVYFYLEPFVIEDFTGVESSHSVNLHYGLESVK